MSAQTQLFHVTGNAPGALLDSTGNNLVTNLNGVTASAGWINFVNDDSRLNVDTFTSLFDINGTWRIEAVIQLANPQDSVCIIDFRSNSSTGHMQLGYDPMKGIYFSDRYLNGIYGSLVRDSDTIASSVPVKIELLKTATGLEIYRDGILTSADTFTRTLSSLSTTTVGYSQDFRYAHDQYKMDYILIEGSPTTGYSENSISERITAYPNPVTSGELLKVQVPLGYTKIEVLDAMGRTLSQVEATEAISTDTWTSGIYFLKISSTHTTLFQKVVCR